tara:strand:+ start:623 stop:1357 length:735 start_codon:yes stop_codon:yes gene_type:complete
MKYLLLLIFLASCGTSDDESQRRNVGEYFTGSGVVQYFLPDLPVWAETVSSLGCHRESSVRFFDLNKLSQSFGLDYQQSIQFQISFNIDRAQRSLSNGLSLVEEERLFYSVSERIQAGIMPFKIPKFKKINLIVIDPLMKDKSKIAAFKKMLATPTYLSAYPVFVSLCYSEKTARKLISDLNFDGEFSVLPMSTLSPFDSNGDLKSIPTLNIKDFFGKDKNITLIEPKGISIGELSGVDARKAY